MENWVPEGGGAAVGIGSIFHAIDWSAVIVRFM